ncbi:MAG: hypothetical protein RLZZ272_1484 [Actinomycetota bacterium]
MRLSPTFVRTIEECNLRARWSRIDAAPREVPPADAALRYGTAAHAALETLVTAVVAAGAVADLTEDLWRQRTAAAVSEAVDEHGPFPKDVVERLHRIVSDHAEDLATLDARDVLGVEVPLRWRAGTDTPVIGFADRVDRIDASTVRVTDYKTGRRAFTADDVQASLQLQTYAVAAASRHRWAEAVEVEVAQLDRRERERARWSAEELARIAEELAERYLAADRRITEGPWEATEGDWCRICEFATLCPAKGGEPAPGTWDPRIPGIRDAHPRLPGLDDAPTGDSGDPGSPAR